MTSPFILMCAGVTKSFGSHTVLNNISMSLGRGIVALTGKNGAGKTTLIEAIAGITSLDSGRIEILGSDLVTDAFAARTKLAFVPDASFAYEFMTGLEFLLMVCALRNVQISAGDHKLQEKMGLTPHLNVLVSAMSLGTRKKLMLASGLLGDAALILLDEPTNGLDAFAKQALADAIILRSQYALVFLSTHDAAFISMTNAKTLDMHDFHAGAAAASNLDLMTQSL